MRSTNLSRILIGGFIIFLGVGFLLEQFYPELRFGNTFWNFWPLVFVIIGLVSLSNNPRSPFFGLFFFVLGVLLIIGNIYGFSIWQFWPVVFILIGLSVLLGRNSFIANSATTSTTGDKVNENVVFWGSSKKVTSKNFEGGIVNAVFGGIDLDLTHASISKENVRLEANAIFGGIDIKVPSDMSVRLEGVGILGAFEGQNLSNTSKEKTLVVTGSAIFGGVEVRAI